METIFVLLPLALLVAAVAVGFFVWAARTGQFDDLETPAVRILFDDQEAGVRSREAGDNPESPVLNSEAGRASSQRRVSE